jgi:hypothetical protein
VAWFDLLYLKSVEKGAVGRVVVDSVKGEKTCHDSGHNELSNKLLKMVVQDGTTCG